MHLIYIYLVWSSSSLVSGPLAFSLNSIRLKSGAIIVLDDGLCECQALVCLSSIWLRVRLEREVSVKEFN